MFKNRFGVGKPGFRKEPAASIFLLLHTATRGLALAALASNAAATSSIGLAAPG